MILLTKYTWGTERMKEITVRVDGVSIPLKDKVTIIVGDAEEIKVLEHSYELVSNSSELSEPLDKDVYILGPVASLDSESLSVIKQSKHNRFILTSSLLAQDLNEILRIAVVLNTKAFYISSSLA